MRKNGRGVIRLGDSTHLEDVYMTYRKIIKTHEVASTSESDDWRTQSNNA